MITAVLFDLDGTLVDTVPDLGAALNHVLQTEGQATLNLETIRPYAASGSAKLIALGFGENHPEQDQLQAKLLNHYEAHVADHSELFAGMSEVLETLDARHIPYGIVTNKPARFTEPLCHRLDIDQRLTLVVSGDSTPYSKPHPEPLKHACMILDMAPENVLYIGDTSVDIEACQQANMPMLYAEYGYQETPIKDDNVLGRIAKPLEILHYL